MAWRSTCSAPAGRQGGTVLPQSGVRLSSTSISFTLPATGPNAPATGPGSFVVSNKGATGVQPEEQRGLGADRQRDHPVSFGDAGASTITVNGTGFSTLTVINLFNMQGGGVVNLGGLKPGGKPKIPLTFVNANQFTFTRPAGAVAGSSYVQALNPPFVPFTSSGNDPGGSFTLWATSTALASSPNPSTVGQPVTLTATVTPATLAVSGAPTGTVTFKDGGAVLGTGTLSRRKGDLADLQASQGQPFHHRGVRGQRELF